MKLITVVTPCFNEEDNIDNVYLRVRSVFEAMPYVRYEHLFIDNCSTDATVQILRKLATVDPNVKVILNSRNFGPVRSPFYGLMQANGDAAVLLVADLQDPPELIKEFVSQWLSGKKVVIGVKPSSEESPIMFAIRRLYYIIVTRIAELDLIQNFTGFGLYDQQIIGEMRKIEDPYPYFRGIVCEIGFDVEKITYNQPRRIRGISKYNFYALYDMAMLGITSNSRVPLRLATMFGFLVATLSLIVSIIYLIMKLIFWHSFPLGTAPILIGMFFFASVQLFFIGILGEYIGTVLLLVKKRPLVVERERINF